MHVTISPEDEVVSIANGDRGLLFDSEGIGIDRAIEANLTTGEVASFAIDNKGRQFLSPDRSGLAVEVKQYELPLTFIRRDKP